MRITVLASMLEALCENLASAMFGMLTPVEVATTRGCSRAMLARFDQSARAVWGAAASHIILAKVLAHIPTARAAAVFGAMYPRWNDAPTTSDFLKCALFQACSRGWLDKLRWMASNVRTVGPVTSVDLHAPLKAACRGGHLTVVQWLVRTYDIRRNQLEQVRSGAFEVPRAYLEACNYGHLQTVQWFVEHYEFGSWIYRRIGVGGIVIASCSDRLEVVQWLFDRFNYFDLTEYETALKHASKWGSLRVAQWAFDQATISDDVASELMLRACTHGRLAMVRLIVDRCGLIPDGSQVCWFDDTKRRLTVRRIDHWFQTAIDAGHLEVVQWLIARFQSGCVDVSSVVEVVSAPEMGSGRTRVLVGIDTPIGHDFLVLAGDAQTLAWLKDRFESSELDAVYNGLDMEEVD